MTALDSIMPTHATIARAAAGRAPLAERAISPNERAVPAEPRHLKYIIAKDSAGGPPRIILFSRDLQHKAMLPAGHTATSAGFLLIYDGDLVIPNIGSPTLAKDPAPTDKDTITTFLGL